MTLLYIYLLGRPKDMDIDFLKRKREITDKTQSDVARVLGITTQSYFKIEAGINNLHPRHWQKIQKLFSITEEELSQFVAFVVETKRRKKNHIENDFSENLKDRIAFIQRLSEQEYAELVNAYEDKRLDLFQLAKTDDIENFRDRAIAGVGRLDISADAKGKVIDLLSNLEQINKK